MERERERERGGGGGSGAQNVMLRDPFKLVLLETRRHCHDHTNLPGMVHRASNEQREDRHILKVTT